MRGEIPYRYGIDTVSIPGFVLWIQYRYTETETKTQTETETCARSLANVAAVEPWHWALEMECSLKARAIWSTEVEDRKNSPSHRGGKHG